MDAKLTKRIGKWKARRNAPVRLGNLIIRVSRKVTVTVARIALDENKAQNVK